MAEEFTVQSIGNGIASVTPDLVLDEATVDDTTLDSTSQTRTVFRAEIHTNGDNGVRGRTDVTEYGLLPTIQAIDGNGEGRPLRLKKDAIRNPDKPGNWRGDLKDYIAMLPTPTQVDHKSRGPNSKQVGMDNLLKVTPIGAETGRKLRLQPAMTEWMMGFPNGWCDFPTEAQSAKQDGAKRRLKPTAMP